MDTWAVRSPDTTVAATLQAAAAALAEADGVTISGGEPFDQFDALERLLRGIRAITTADILVFSGHPLERIETALARLDGLIDCIMADPFIAGVPQTLALRGSDNQRMKCLTPLGRQRFASCDRALLSTDRALDVLFDDETGEIFLAGIPRPGDMRKLSDMLALGSHRAITTEGKGRCG
jgi:anaerobic ribonucleoside-triphosphate reductase activating protein